ncbi:ceramide kinase protein [Dioscorea alata]|uniref:Ceramide kinase protein n=1 Tax=Dioscorea alata TaxID=55571 RepID=A0ACB7UGJ6_DIOAL|nr:ceramide kinase protein [Dioscorea alata]
MERNGSALPSSALFLDRVGEVRLTLNGDGFSWKPIDSDHAELNSRSCLGIKINGETEAEIKYSDIYAIECIGWGLIHDFTASVGGLISGRNLEMFRFVVHSYYKQGASHAPGPWILSEYMFGHNDLKTCQAWAEQLNSIIQMEIGRPKSLLVFVHPLCGKGKGWKNWETVAPLFSRAKVEVKVNVTQRAGHAYDIITSSTDKVLGAFDGIVAVGGDGLFNEILNGLLSSRHKAPYPPAPVDFGYTGSLDQDQQHRINSFDDRASNENDAHEPLISTSESNGGGISNIKHQLEQCNADQDPVLSFPNDWFRLGLIPSGSTDAIVISTTGLRDPITSALQIILGYKAPLDIAQVVRWKTRLSSVDVPFVRYAASFVGYGFYGDVIKESEKYRWMGPVRYDYAGTKVFLKHRSFEAEVAFLETESVETTTRSSGKTQSAQLSPERPKKMICCRNCTVCKETMNSIASPANRIIASPGIHSGGSRWLRSKGRFLSIGGAVISCRNERAPDGLVADAHLADGFLHLIMIKDCPRPSLLMASNTAYKKGF